MTRFRRSRTAQMQVLSSKNKHDVIEFFPAFEFRDPSDNVERCQHAYRRVVAAISRYDR